MQEEWATLYSLWACYFIRQSSFNAQIARRHFQVKKYICKAKKTWKGSPRFQGGQASIYFTLLEFLASLHLWKCPPFFFDLCFITPKAGPQGPPLPDEPHPLARVASSASEVGAQSRHQQDAQPGQGGATRRGRLPWGAPGSGRWSWSFEESFCPEGKGSFYSGLRARSVHCPIQFPDGYDDGRATIVNIGGTPKDVEETKLIRSDYGNLASRFQYLGFGLWENTDPSAVVRCSLEPKAGRKTKLQPLSIQIDPEPPTKRVTVTVPPPPPPPPPRQTVPLRERPNHRPEEEPTLPRPQTQNDEIDGLSQYNVNLQHCQEVICVASTQSTSKMMRHCLAPENDYITWNSPRIPLPGSARAPRERGHGFNVQVFDSTHFTQTLL